MWKVDTGQCFKLLSQKLGLGCIRDYVELGKDCAILILIRSGTKNCVLK